MKGIVRNNYSNSKYSSKDASGTYITDLQLSNNFKNLQNVSSLYNSWQFNLEPWSLKAGVRLEHTKITADFISSVTAVQQDYLNLLPTVSLSLTFKDKSSLGFGYSKRIQRPGIWELDPYVDRSNPNFEYSGNPNLRPVIANNFQLNFIRSKKTSLSMSLSHSFSNNTKQYIILFNPVTKVNRWTASNTGSVNSTGINLNVGHPLTSRSNVNFTANVNYIFVKGYVNGLLKENDGMNGSFRGTASYRFENGWQISSSVGYRLYPDVLLQGSGISIFESGLSMSKDLLKKKLSISASADNPFKKYQHFPNYIKEVDYEFENDGRGYFRAFSCSLNYKFGKLKSTIAKNKRGINNDDVDAGPR
jgi:outer membrane receptor protein involved in Fe transport